VSRRPVTDSHRQQVVRILTGESNGGCYKPSVSERERRRLKNRPLSMKEICDLASVQPRMIRTTVRTMVEEGLICTSQVSFNSERGSSVTITYYLNPDRVDDYVHFLKDRDVARRVGS